MSRILSQYYHKASNDWILLLIYTENSIKGGEEVLVAQVKKSWLHHASRDSLVISVSSWRMEKTRLGWLGSY